MPCENCRGQFTMFNRKHVCGKCKRHFCGVCLKGSRKGTICEICQIFISRPLLRDELMNVRTKDLIFYLQSEHIPITGCVEKEDLINLVMQHAHDVDYKKDNNTGTGINNKTAESSTNETFNNTPLEIIRQTCHNFFSNLTDNVNDLYVKSRNEKSRQPNSVTQQPRISIREMPAYSDRQMTNIVVSSACKSNTIINTVKLKNSGNCNLNLDNQSNSQVTVSNDDSNQIITASTSTGSTYTRLSSSRSKVNFSYDKNDYGDNEYDDESLLISSNELGAIGGISDNNNNNDDDDNKCTLSTNITRRVEDIQNGITTNSTTKNVVEGRSSLMETQLPSISNTLTRRHSENLNLYNYAKNCSIGSKNTFQQENELMSITKTCKYCANNKTNIRQQIERMRQHLESTQMSEIDIKEELSKFLSFLEQRTKSIEYSHSESDISSIASDHLAINDRTCFYSPHKANSNDYLRTSHFINLYHFESTQELKNLTVKELKKILMLNRVDFAGCCEKGELLDRVEILWKNLKSTPTVDKLPSSDLCKVCMDAPIECVILECGHMATCTNCGKILCECPICRQYIVRVVRFFRA